MNGTDNDIAITNIEITIGGQKTNLSVDEARQLLYVLRNLFSYQSVVTAPVHYYPTIYFSDPLMWEVKTDGGNMFVSVIDIERPVK